MAGIYIHIPFCKKACHYCNFHFSTTATYQDEMISALTHEIELQNNFWGIEKIDTIYFGGGTPSILKTQQIALLLEKISKTFSLKKNIEITLEANPDDLKTEKIKELISIGVNRLSIGIQSFFEEDLIFMNRSHNAQQAFQCIENTRNSGIENFSVDLIFGFPLLSEKKWIQNMNRILQMDIPHVSCYAMTVEPKTALDSFIKKLKLPPLNEEQSAKQFLQLIDTLENANYHHYEISNFAKPGFEAVHNRNYWRNKIYLGIGPSAHSFDSKNRSWNIANNIQYMKAISENKIPAETEALSRENRINEYIMISLRTSEGISKKNVQILMNKKELDTFEHKIKNLIQRELLFVKDDFCILTKKGKLYADGMASELFV